MSYARTYEVADELTSDQYVALIALVGRRSAHFGVVVRPDLGCDASCRRFLKGLEPHLLTLRSASDWPGTRLLDGRANVYTYTASRRLLKIVTAQTSDFREWLQPALPEDPWFAHQDGSVLMETISHEADVLLRLTETERRDLELIVNCHLVEVESEA